MAQYGRMTRETGELPSARRYGPEVKNPHYAPLPLPGTGKALLVDAREVAGNVSTLVGFVRREAGSHVKRIAQVFGCPMEAVELFADIGIQEGRLARAPGGYLEAC